MKAVLINKHLNIKQKRFWASVLLVQFFLFYCLSKSEVVISFCNRLFEDKKQFHQFIFSKIYFSVGDVLYVVIVLFLIIFIFNLFKKKKRQKSAISILIFFNIFYFIYQLFWGLLYFQSPILKQLPKEEITLNEAKSLSFKYLKLCIEDRENVEANKYGVFAIANLDEVKMAVLKNQNSLPTLFVQKKSTLINDFKPSLFRSVMSYTGILGYYNPFTAEAQYNSELPATFLPFTLAHESAHQLGFARENEANFIGFLIGKNSENKSLKYSTDLFALKSLLSYINETDPVFVNRILTHYSAGMRQDRKYDQIFRKKHESFLDTIFAITNNLFLKSNQQDGSITYSYFTEMLIKYERKEK
ncbi:DUF3810 domain-containing protein [Halpernia sp.]|uniref:DUF3810 domain-containing protein n=1 Tax=Halpernia sp. TaxID=2782209 RepID=UPI003A8FA10E